MLKDPFFQLALPEPGNATDRLDSRWIGCHGQVAEAGLLPWSRRVARAVWLAWTAGCRQKSRTEP